MQISTANGNGTIAITNGNARVIASAGVSWLAAQTALVAGDAELSIVGSALVPYGIAAVYEPGHAGNTTGDRWELVVVGIIYEAANAAASYAISIDWIPLGSSFLWDPQKGDTQTLQFEKRNWRLIASLIGNSTPIKSGSVALTNGQQTAVITGIPTQTAVSGIFVYRVVCSFENTIDASPTVVKDIVTVKAATTCTISFNPRPSNANTIMRYNIFAT